MIRLITYREFQEILETKDFDYLCKWLKENWIVISANDYLEQMNLMFAEKYKNYNGTLNDLVSNLIGVNNSCCLIPFHEIEQFKKIILDLDKERWNVLKRIIDDNFIKIEKLQKIKNRGDNIAIELRNKLSIASWKTEESINQDRFCIVSDGTIHMCDRKEEENGSRNHS